jgi:hypothetical protein
MPGNPRRCALSRLGLSDSMRTRRRTTSAKSRRGEAPGRHKVIIIAAHLFFCDSHCASTMSVPSSNLQHPPYAHRRIRMRTLLQHSVDFRFSLSGLRLSRFQLLTSKFKSDPMKLPGFTLRLRDDDEVTSPAPLLPGHREFYERPSRTILK